MQSGETFNGEAYLEKERYAVVFIMQNQRTQSDRFSWLFGFGLIGLVTRAGDTFSQGPSVQPVLGWGGSTGRGTHWFWMLALGRLGRPLLGTWSAHSCAVSCCLLSSRDQEPICQPAFAGDIIPDHRLLVRY